MTELNTCLFVCLFDLLELDMSEPLLAEQRGQRSLRAYV